MRSILLLFAAVTATASTTVGAQACSIRGQYCGYQSWAANAFEGRHGFKGNPAILTDRDQKPSVADRPVRKVSRQRNR